MSELTLAQWLARIEVLHPQEVDLGLERIARVLARLALDPGGARIITVGGTNGKGSCAAYLDAILAGAGYRTAVYTSPHLLRYNERVRIDGCEVSDEALVAALERVERARGADTLTYFEFGTLAAAALFADARCDVWILEVGLGGRLDAVNVFDADVAVIASIGLDHQDWLGADLASIGREKAGIMRRHRPAVYGGLGMPDSIAAVAAEVDARLLRFGHEFGVRPGADAWSWWSGGRSLAGLPLPAMSGSAMLRNASCALMAVEAAGLRLERAAVERALRSVRLDGRFQVFAAEPEWILDVGHNPDAAAELAANLAARPCRGRTIAVFAMLGDKDVTAVSRALAERIDHWLVPGLDGPRALAAEEIVQRLDASVRCPVEVCASAVRAFSRAAQLAAADDRVLVCGSFHVVGPALERLYSAARSGACR